MPPTQAPAAPASTSWQQAAAGAASSQPQAAAANGAQKPATPAAPTAAPPKPPVMTVAAPPPEAAPVKEGGFRGFMNKVVNTLAGTDTSTVRQDPQGNLYIQHRTMTRGQQWLKIGIEALQGAGAGLAAGRGAGNSGKALTAGFQVAQQNQQNQTEAQKQQILELANISTLNHQNAANALAMTRMQVTAAQDDIKFSEAQADRLTAGGAERAAHVDSLQALTKFMRDTPNFNKDQAATAMYTPVATYGPDGKADGFDIYRTLPGSNEEILPPGTEVPFFNSLDGKIEMQKTAGPMKRGDVNAAWAAAGNARQKYMLDQATIKEKNANAQAKLSPAPKPETPSTTALHEAQAQRAYAATDLDKAKKRQIETGQLQPDGSPNPRFEQLAEAVYDGSITPNDLKRESRGMGLDPNQVLGRAVEIGNEKGQPFSESIIKQEYKFAESPKTQAALDGIDRILSPTTGYMKQMMDTAKAADLGTNGAFNSASLAVQRFFGSSEAKNFNTAVTELRRSIAGLIGNPLLGGSETDKKLEQADALIGQSPTMKNLTAAQAILENALRAQRESIVGNNRYLRQRYGMASSGAAAQTPAATAVRVNPGEPTAKAADGSTLVVRNGQWVPAQP